MTELLLARGRMAMLVGFPVVFAVAGMGMPMLPVVAEAASREDALSGLHRKNP